MTDAQKKMKHYVNAIERRLNMPWKVRGRVMLDFSSAIQARREAGKTDEEIYAEFGTPKEAAAELNEQMKEFQYRKSPWRFAFLALGFLSGLSLTLPPLILELAGAVVGHILYPSRGNAASIGIIGGADGPTAIFVTRSGPDWESIVLVALCLIGFVGYFRLCRCKQK